VDLGRCRLPNVDDIAAALTAADTDCSRFPGVRLENPFL
jgi:hypothetical protein